jgi:hypothetical protein
MGSRYRPCGERHPACHESRQRRFDAVNGQPSKGLDLLGAVEGGGAPGLKKVGVVVCGARGGEEERPGGLKFPGDKEPGQLDFAYFSFTVGTSFAASDVKVTSRASRRVVLGHTILSFVYNTVLIAVVINVITDL